MEINLDKEFEDAIFIIASIKNQIQHAKSKVVTSGEYADPDWFARANSALRYNQVRHQQLLRARGDKTRQERTAHNKRFERFFIEAARATLDNETYQQIIQLAHREADRFDQTP